MVLTLYKLDPSPPVRAVLMMLETLKIKDVKYIDVNIIAGEHLKPEYLKINPQHTVPTLLDDDFALADRHLMGTLREDLSYLTPDYNYRKTLQKISSAGKLYSRFIYSHAIAAYLVNKYAKDDSLYPKDPKKRAIVDQRLHFDSGILFPTLRNTVMPVFYGGDISYSAENLEKIQSAYTFSEAFLDKQYAAGDQLTIADVCWAATISTLDGIKPIDASKYPKLSAWLARVSKLDFYQKANVSGLKEIAAMLDDKLATNQNKK